VHSPCGGPAQQNLFIVIQIENKPSQKSDHDVMRRWLSFYNSGNHTTPMKTTAPQFFFAQLNDSQKTCLQALRQAIDPVNGTEPPAISGRGPAATAHVLIGILETWLLDEEQKQSLNANPCAGQRRRHEQVMDRKIFSQHRPVLLPVR
jgi:hypothetical protein